MISVIIPTYNRANVIRRSIDSVLNQTYKDLELIIIDDNSSDNTEQIINDINDKRLRYIKLNENKGACFARNYGITISKGEYIAFQDSDDEWCLDKLKLQYDYLEKRNLDVVSCRVEIFADKNIIFPRRVDLTLDSVYLDNRITTQTILGKRICFEKVKFDETLLRFQDWDLVINLFKEYKIEILDKVLVKVYQQDDSITKNPKKAITSLETYLKKHSINRKMEAHYIRLIGVYKLQNGDKYSKYFRTAFCKYPFSLKIILDFILSSLGMTKQHYNFYVKRGRFK